uniref:Chromosome 3 open reading frame 84 n=1 Tax=Varanus komodoensis TaxID=61221 RepID=A0A8D2LKG9_VARKO
MVGCSRTEAGVQEMLLGSHANGFYGNFRSRCRSDFTQEYRKAAQPQPPDLFLRRMKETPSKHIFSKHDNRHAFPGSATYFENGLGRRRIEGSLPNTHNIIDWIPLKEELQRERPLISSYQSDFRSRDKVPQVLVCHTNLQGQSLQRTPSTTYQRTYRSYCLREPSLSIVKQQEAKEPKLEEPEEFLGKPPTVLVHMPPAGSHLFSQFLLDHYCVCLIGVSFIL